VASLADTKPLSALKGTMRVLLFACVACSSLALASSVVCAPAQALSVRAVASSERSMLRLRGGCAEAAPAEAAPAEAAPAEAAPAEAAPVEKKKYDLDGWKRLYSNTDDTNTILDQFWADYDPEEWSIWMVDYKNNADYEKKLMASNLIGGWFQRLDGTGTRKIAFGNVHVFGKEPTLEIAGCFLVKGHEIPQEFKDVADFEQWDWTKADTSDEAVRKIVNDYWRWDGDFGKGRTWAAGKTYK